MAIAEGNSARAVRESSCLDLAEEFFVQGAPASTASFGEAGDEGDAGQPFRLVESELDLAAQPKGAAAAEVQMLAASMSHLTCDNTTGSTVEPEMKNLVVVKRPGHDLPITRRSRRAR
jgi:hypothetical protein